MWLKKNIDPMKYLDLFLHVGGKKPTNLPLTPTWGVQPNPLSSGKLQSYPWVKILVNTLFDPF